MSKNVVDAVLEYSKLYNIPFTFIPSRRQIDYKSGYVNNWTTESFSKYIKKANLPTISIQRDHGGPGQGDIDDDGILSFETDIQFLDSIHIDPWKKYPKYEDALAYTIQMMEHCYTLNKEIWYEVGTEEAIREISEETLKQFLEDLKQRLAPELFSKIKFVVIQCGTGLLEKENIGHFDERKLVSMLSIVKSYGLHSKEHNGDWVSYDIIEKKRKLGLEYINIAPEFGEIETKVILEAFRANPADVEEFYRICLASGKWKKWVSSKFDPENNKEKLILICGHYVFSNPDFITLLEKYDYSLLKDKIRVAIFDKLHLLHAVYTERKMCLMCEDDKLDTYFSSNLSSSLSLHFSDGKSPGFMIPFNVVSCRRCHTVQTKYLGNPKIIYGKNHVDTFGTTKKDMIESFASFISNNTNIQGILEVGTPTADLANEILKSKDLTYSIVEPDFIDQNKSKLKVYKSFFEDFDLSCVSANTLILSHIFEHLYEPRLVLEKIQKSQIQYIYFNHPNFEYYAKNNVYNILNIEHISYFEEKFLIDMLGQKGFELQRRFDYNNHSVYLEFKRCESIISIQPKNIRAIEDTHYYFNEMQRKIKTLNSMFQEKSKQFFLWPASAHNITLLNMGLNHKALKGFLDNSPNKIGKVLYGYDVPCYNFQEFIHTTNEDTIIIIGCSGNYIKELNLDKMNKNILFLEDI